MKKHAFIDKVIAKHRECELLYYKDIIVLSVEYSSGKCKYYFPQREEIPKRIKEYIGTSLQYYIDSTTTIYKFGYQYGY